MTLGTIVGAAINTQFLLDAYNKYGFPLGSRELVAGALRSLVLVDNPRLRWSWLFMPLHWIVPFF